MAIQIRWSSRYNQWTADMPNQGGCRKREYFGKDKQAAQAKFHRMMADFYATSEEKHREQPAADEVTLAQLSEQFLTWNRANKAHNTWRSYRDGLRYVLERYPDIAISRVTPSDIETIKKDMVSQGFRSRTINKMVAALKRLYNWAVKQKLAEDNPVRDMEHVSDHVNAPQHPRKKHLMLQKARESVMLCHDSPPLGDICEFTLMTGMRIGEVVRITWEDVDLEERFLRLELHKTSRYNARPRTIPLCRRAVEILEKQNMRLSKLRKKTGCKTVFMNDRGQPFKVFALQNRLKRLRKKHPQLIGFSFHKLRHTCATYLAREQVPERVAQAILGHNSSLMTRYYTATASSEMLDAVEKLSQAASSGTH